MIEEDQTNRLNADQKVLIKDLFSQGVKHKMKVNLGRQLSRPSGKGLGPRRLSIIKVPLHFSLDSAAQRHQQGRVRDLPGRD